MSPSALPAGLACPPDGRLPEAAAAEVGTRALGVYLHVPFCATRCGYCDFNTYTAAELGAAPGTSRQAYLEAALAEVTLARRVLGPGAPPVSTVFVGGGTPTLLAAGQLGRLLARVRTEFGLAPGAEISTEANPESVDQAALDRLVAAGFTRISFGMQSAVPHVLATLDRVHSPGRAVECVGQARAAGFAQVSLDLIYGTPGESMTDWQASLDAALGSGPDHLSAYALIVEQGTRLAARIRRGELGMPEEDDLADKYLAAEERLSGAGFAAYEVSNWARGDRARCRHNLGYWRSDHWWGIGPGAHSHVGGVRWWNVKHPRAYAGRLGEGRSPGHAREVLDPEQRRVERILLELRLADGLDPGVLTDTERARVPGLVGRGLLAAEPGPLRLTLAGRLLADGVVRDLVD